VAEPILYDAFGVKIEKTARLSDDRQAEIGRRVDRWAGQTTGEVTPEKLAAVLRGNAPLQQVMLLAARMLDDDHVFTCMRNLALALSRLSWEILPFDESASAKKDAEKIRDQFYAFKPLKKFIRYLVFGEYYPFVGASLFYSRDFRLEGYGNIDPWRWNWDEQTNSVRLLTVDSPHIGEEIENRRAFAIHSASLEPGPVRRRGLWRKIAWLWLFKNFTWPAWVRFAEAYGNPYILAFFRRPEERDSVLEAVTALDENARGVFPEGTEVKFQEAQRYGTSALYDAVKRAAEEGMTKVLSGHVLNTDAKSGSGTLAGNAAENVSQANIEGVAAGVEETVQQDVTTTVAEFTLGASQVASGEIPAFHIKADPPEDQAKKAQVYVSVNQALAASGRAIDPSQIEDEFGVRTVALQRTVGAAEDEDPEPDNEQKPKQKAKAKARRVAAKAPRITTADDVSAVMRTVAASAVREMGDALMARLEGAESIGEFAEAIWEGYAELDPTKLASALRDATLAANMIGRGEAGE
jgi:phage gp29-like protein